MSAKVMKFEATPNPNAVKCVIRGDLPGAGSIRSYFSADQAASDPLAERLFAIPGVTNLLITQEWITVNKAADADWGPIKRGVRLVLAQAGSK